MAIFARRSSIQIPRYVRHQVFAYFRSPEFTSSASLTTTRREKHVAHTVDIEILLKAMWTDKCYFRTARERVTATCLTTIQSLTDDRPGAFTISANRPDCTDSILYRHIDVRIQPNPDAPRSPYVYIMIKINDIKNS